MVDQQEAGQRPLADCKHQEFVGAAISAGKSMAEAQRLWREYRDFCRELLSEGYSTAEAVRLIIDSDRPPPPPPRDEMRFGLERDLQKALRLNIKQLEPGLEITDGGKEQQTDAGNIDITAKDGQGTTVVIELKAGDAPPESVTQILAYMGALQQKGQSVRGILVAGKFPDRVRFAARAVPDLKLMEYSFNFTFSRVQLGTTQSGADDPS